LFEELCNDKNLDKLELNGILTNLQNFEMSNDVEDENNSIEEEEEENENKVRNTRLKL
jgi:hypothetical protein